MSDDIMRYSSDQFVEPLGPATLSFREERKHGKALTRMEYRANSLIRGAELQAEVGRAKIQAIASVGSDALTAQALISSREKLLVEAEPGAVHGISHISTKLTIALGAVVDHTLRELTK